MAGVKKLECEIGERGPRIVVNGMPLMVGCLTQREVDEAIALLKTNLDLLKVEMKAAIHRQRSEMLRFE